jgi:hypothetical protein
MVISTSQISCTVFQEQQFAHKYHQSHMLLAVSTGSSWQETKPAGIIRSPSEKRKKDERLVLT